jgi:hypothetical protein
MGCNIFESYGFLTTAFSNLKGCAAQGGNGKKYGHAQAVAQLQYTRNKSVNPLLLFQPLREKNKMKHYCRIDDSKGNI